MNYTDAAANGATLVTQYTELDQCLDGCRFYTTDCLAVQWRDSSSDCFFVFDVNNVYARYAAEGVVLYYLRQDCITTGENQNAVAVQTPSETM